MLHELGHFLTAKKFGMRVTQFFVGFGQTLWSTFRGETEYGVKALPFGGFVKITGMTSVEEVDVADEPRSFRNQPGWQRIIVLAAGSFMHFALALFLLFVLAIGIGQTANTNVISSIAGCVPASATALKNDANPCAAGNLPKSPAEVAGLKAGDKIISVAGQPVGNWDSCTPRLTAQQAGVPRPGCGRAAVAVMLRLQRHAGGGPGPLRPLSGCRARGRVSAQQLLRRGVLRRRQVRQHADVLGLGHRQAASRHP